MYIYDLIFLITNFRWILNETHVYQFLQKSLKSIRQYTSYFPLFTSLISCALLKIAISRAS